jgi:hypothetical protein
LAQLPLGARNCERWRTAPRRPGPFGGLVAMWHQPSFAPGLAASAATAWAPAHGCNRPGWLAVPRALGLTA